MAQEVKRSIKFIPRGINEALLVATGAKQCYDGRDPFVIYNELLHKTNGELRKYIKKRLEAGHVSILAHGVATCTVSGYSRRFLSQITRHTFIKPSVQSQQFIEHRDFGFVSTPLIDLVPHVKEAFVNHMTQSQNLYTWMRGELTKFLENNPKFCNIFNKDQPKDDSRLVLPNAAESNMLLTGTFWAWYEMLPQRLCLRNTEETVAFAQDCLTQLQELAPEVFDYCGAPCQMKGCPEDNPCRQGGYTGSVFEEEPATELLQSSVEQDPPRLGTSTCGYCDPSCPSNRR